VMNRAAVKDLQSVGVTNYEPLGLPR